jgi:electron transport complex protein RnfG
MRDMVKMVVVLTLLSTVSGGLLAAIHNQTAARIENQILEYVQGPAIKTIFKGATNNPIADRFKLKDGDVERTFFVAVYDGTPRGVAFETHGKGFGGDVGLMVGIDTKTNKLYGVEVTTHSETPGMGARATTDPDFAPQFKGMNLGKPFKVTQDGGSVNALSGATITSRAVCSAATDADKIYERLKPQIEKKLKEFKK